MSHSGKIAARWWGPSLLTLLVGGCGGTKIPEAQGRDAPTPVLPPPRPIGEVYVLETSSVPPEDTTVRAAVGATRVILLRHGAPDNSLFARFDFPPQSLRGTPGDSITITIKPRPGRYGVDLEFPGDTSAKVTITFSYAADFVAPRGARERYGSDLEFEKLLLIGQLQQDRVVHFLPTGSPGSDMVSATVSGPGRYLVAAPR